MSVSELEHRLTGLAHGDHLCTIYESRAEQMATAVPFIRDGLAAGECCAYIADDQTTDEVKAALAEAGVDVALEEKRGALQLLTKRSSYLRSGAFDPSAMIDFLGETVDAVLREGFQGFRVTGEMTWALGSEEGCERVIEYEALLNGFFPGKRALAICQYNRKRFSPTIIKDVLRTHPVAVLGDQMCGNVYYEPPELILSGGGDEERVEWMIAQLQHIDAESSERRRAEERLREADRRKDEFLATLAHELRNPLAPVRNALQLIRLAGDDERVREESILVMERQVVQLVRLIDDLLDLSRITRNKLELRKEWVELSVAVQSAVETAGPFIEAGEHELSIELPDTPVVMHADPTRLSQVLANLLTNAAKYSERGGKIQLSAEREGTELTIRVRDTGIGLAAEEVSRVFEMFMQVEAALGRAQGGLGIGLTLVRRLVQLHGGTVEARSAGLGRGCEFIVRLPVLDPGATKPPHTLEAGRGSEGLTGRVLVVDDSPDSAESLASILRLRGAEVRTASDGLRAIEVAADMRPDLIVLDIGMPNLDGYETVRRIRREPWGREVLIVAMTGWGQPEDKRRAVEAGFDHHITKPVDPAVFESYLARLKRRD